MQVPLRRDKLWHCESQAAPWNTGDSQPLHLPHTTEHQHHHREKLFIFMQNTDPALRKQRQKAVSA